VTIFPLTAHWQKSIFQFPFVLITRGILTGSGKTPIHRHSREGGSPECIEKTGFRFRRNRAEKDFFSKKLMKKIITTALVMLSLLLTTQGSAQDCTPDSVEQMKPNWKLAANTNLGSPGFGIPDMKQIISRTSKYFELVKNVLPDPVGVTPKYYTVGNSPIAPGAPLGYSLNLHFLEMWCRQKKVIIAAETDYWAYIFVNQLGWVLPGNDRIAHFTLADGQAIWKNANAVTDQLFRGYPLISGKTHSGALTVFIGSKNRLPVRPVTKEELIQSYKTYWVKHYADEIKRLEDSKKNMLNTKPSPEKLKKSGYTEEKIQQLYQAIEKGAANHDRAVAELQADRDKKIPMLDTMLSRMDDAQRKSPAKTDYLNAMVCQPEKLLNEVGTPLITMDASYFDPQLPKYVPQFFIVYLRPPAGKSNNKSIDALSAVQINRLW
jgi:hypothetical protein